MPSGHHFAPTEPAGETLPPSLREVPPEAVEGVKKGETGGSLHRAGGAGKGVLAGERGNGGGEVAIWRGEGYNKSV